MKKMVVLLSLLLTACDPQSKPAQSSSQDFYDTHLFFDMETEAEKVNCPIHGQIPNWLSGILLRNGPAKFTVGNKRVTWFDGLAMLHAFEFNTQKVVYSNRFLRSEQYYIMTVEKTLNFSGFSQDPCPQVFKDQKSHFIPKEMKDIQNADVSIQEYADQMVALTEVPLPVIFDPSTLSTIGGFDYQDTLPKSKIWESAHPQHDLASGERINYLVNFGRTSSYIIWKMGDQSSSREIVAEIPVDLPAYMHSFALTEHYVILVEFPFVVNPIDLISKKKPFVFNYKWLPERGTNFIVVDRSSGQLVAKIKGEPFFAFHHVNAFDKEGQIFMDIVTHPNVDVMYMLAGLITQKKGIEESQKTRMQRFTIDLNSKKLSQETIFAKSLELPRIAAGHTAKDYRYCYAVDMEYPTTISESRSLYKVDVTNKSSKSWSKEGCFPGEPIFVPRPDGQCEDDGVVLSVVLDFANHKSFLLILDAADMTEMATAEVPHAIPLGLHGLWSKK